MGWGGPLNHWSSMVVDLEVDVNVKVSPKRSCCFQLGRSAECEERTRATHINVPTHLS